MDCPKCDSIMEAVTFNSITVDRCTQCLGIWFDKIEYKDLKKMKGADAIDTGPSKLGQEYDSMKNVRCAVCEDAMERVHASFQPHLHYEICRKGHGAFFDAGEFKEFAQEGSLADFVKSLALHFHRG